MHPDDLCISDHPRSRRLANALLACCRSGEIGYPKSEYVRINVSTSLCAWVIGYVWFADRWILAYAALSLCCLAVADVQAWNCQVAVGWL